MPIISSPGRVPGVDAQAIFALLYLRCLVHGMAIIILWLTTRLLI